MTSALTPPLLILAAYAPLSAQKAPKTLAESYLFVDQLLRDFGLAGGLAVRDLIEFLKVGLKHSNALARSNATKTLVTLRLFVGPGAFLFSPSFGHDGSGTTY